MPYYDSYLNVWYNFVMIDSVGGWSRIARPPYKKLE